MDRLFSIRNQGFVSKTQFYLLHPLVIVDLVTKRKVVMMENESLLDSGHCV